MEIPKDEYQEEMKNIQNEKKQKENLKKEPTVKIGRNDPCICGSRKKFKKCCITKYSNRQPVSLVKKSRE